MQLAMVTVKGIGFRSCVHQQLRQVLNASGALPKLTYSQVLFPRCAEHGPQWRQVPDKTRHQRRHGRECNVDRASIFRDQAKLLNAAQRITYMAVEITEPMAGTTFSRIIFPAAMVRPSTKKYVRAQMPESLFWLTSVVASGRQRAARILQVTQL
jgi:hypothetical protein